ncbi:hypothetical protein SISNIDRAFT_459681 [Sistotremastrum niveocremeum HHB9708]|uniref:Alpha/beta hydrolase fold-3 domain-containing protein n=2 Tax=Sistotremastraceae TaxID=3402574 RepID=A0A164P824_9AGAM|nr:hypothetical protein SISNIDRAFT_459681 [Sistotremastrum niveocremeum HHB9708]KZT34663.1 hypothetical protein SISSUDRAFT_1052461 [Sistotremastrum suecicum HHB10207 ss-3]
MNKEMPAPTTGYTATDFRIPVEGGEIDARSYVPEKTHEDERFPLLLWTHGGGFIMGSLETDDPDNRVLCTSAKISIVTIDYRLSPEHPFPTQAEDSFAALKWVLKHSEQFSVDGKKGIIVGGLSAGGDIAAVLTLLARDDPEFTWKITGQILEFPVLCSEKAYPPELKEDLQSLIELAEGPYITRTEMNELPELMQVTDHTDFRLSPLCAPSHESLPPAFIQVGGRDPLRDEAIVYGEVLAKNGIAVQTRVYPGTPHAFTLINPNTEVSRKCRKDTLSGLIWLLEGAGI